MSYPVLDDLTFGDAAVLFEATGLISSTYNGTLDGLTLDRAGTDLANGEADVH